MKKFKFKSQFEEPILSRFKLYIDMMKKNNLLSDFEYNMENRLSYSPISGQLEDSLELEFIELYLILYKKFNRDPSDKEFVDAIEIMVAEANQYKTNSKNNK